MSGAAGESLWRARGFGLAARRIEEPGPRLWYGSFRSSWSVPPQCEYGNEVPLRDGCTQVKSGLNRAVEIVD